MHQTDESSKLFGLMAEFDSATGIVGAARRAREAGYRKVEAYTPFPMHELDEALELPRTKLPWLVFFGGLTGMLGGFGLEYWISAINYPLNIGGRPYGSWPAFVVPPTRRRSCSPRSPTVVFMIVLNGLPRPYHPVFNVPAFTNASGDRFFLCIEAADERFDAAATRTFLEGLHPLGVTDVAE